MLSCGSAAPVCAAPICTSSKASGAARSMSNSRTSWAMKTPAGSKRSARGVESVKVGDAVICHPLVTSGHCLACRRGDDMHATDSRFPGINANGGYAQYLADGRALADQAAQSLAPKDVAPYTDAGLTAYRAAKKASRHLLPGNLRSVIGAGGLGHIGIQVLKRTVRAEIIVVDRSEIALQTRKGMRCASHGEGRWQRSRARARADRRQWRRGGNRFCRRRRCDRQGPRHDAQRRLLLHRRLWRKIEVCRPST